MPKAQAVAQVEPQVPAVTITPIELLQMAVQKGADIAQLEKLMDLRDRWEANEARKAFMQAKARFKAEAPNVTKNKHVGFDSRRTGERTDYYHATLDNVADTLAPILAKHGLSYSWETDQKDNASIAVTCVLSHVMGHSERVTLNAMPDASGSKNNIQAIGSTVTFLERYTLLAATGIATKGQDDDGEAAAERPWKGPLGKTELKNAARALAKAITEAGTLDDLKAVQIDNMEVIEQMQNDLPEWYFGDGADVKGAKNMIAERRAALETKETNR